MSENAIKTIDQIVLNGGVKKAPSGKLREALENIGRVDKSRNLDSLKELLGHETFSVRVLAIKNLAKAKDDSMTPLFIQAYESDENSAVRREAISAIGRQRRIENTSFLLSVLTDSDPKIVCQAIRALLVFKGEAEIDSRLRELRFSENEMIQQIIQKEYFSDKPSGKVKKRHTFVDEKLANLVVQGDVLEVLKFVDDESVHLTFTSPPYYNARDYSTYSSYDVYLDFLEEVFEETYRITKEGRFLIVNTSPVIVPRISRAHSSKRYPIPFDLHSRLVDLGWEFIDDIVWKKPEYSVKNRIGGFQQHRKPLAYKPNSITEYLMVYRKSTDKLIDWNMRQYDNGVVEISKVLDGFETTNVWEIHPKADKIHSAIFPEELCFKVIEYYSYMGDLIFDPFAGSGTLGRVAKDSGRKFFMTEQEPKYVDYIRKSIDINNRSGENPTKFLKACDFCREVKNGNNSN